MTGSIEEDLPRIGGRLKHLRLAKRMRLKDLSLAAGCSESLLSRIENNLANPSLTTLHRLCRALGVNVVALLGDGEAGSHYVSKPADRVLLGRGAPGEQAEVLVPYAESRLLEGFITILEPGVEPSGPYQHDGEEVGYVLAGELELTIDGTIHVVKPGDSFFFKSDIEHSYRNAGTAVCRVVWINTPPTF
jgi:transcriptional regulator with XRE-family HTH domain